MPRFALCLCMLAVPACWPNLQDGPRYVWVDEGTDLIGVRESIQVGGYAFARFDSGQYTYATLFTDSTMTTRLGTVNVVDLDSEAPGGLPPSPTTPGLSVAVVGNSPSASAEPTTPTIRVTADALYIRYHANEVAADNRFKDQNLTVTGTVGSVRKDAFGSMYVELRTSNEFSPVRATLRDSEARRAASLTIGAEVVLSCIGAGVLLDSPLVEECRFR